MFEAGYLALSDAVTAPAECTPSPLQQAAVRPRLRMPSLLPSRATRSNRPDAPYGAVFVVDQIEKADSVYRDLNELLPGKVAIWTRTMTAVQAA